MRSGQTVATCYSRLLSGPLAETSGNVIEILQQTHCGKYTWNLREICTSAAAARFRPTAFGSRLPEGHKGEPKADLVDKFLSHEVMSNLELRQQRVREAMQKFQRFPGDTGSSEVQVAILTEKIYAMAEHMKVNRKDFSSRNGLMGMLAQRRKLLQYLRRSDFDAYAKMLSSLGLKDTYKKLDRLAIRRTRGVETPG